MTVVLLQLQNITKPCTEKHIFDEGKTSWCRCVIKTSANKEKLYECT